MYVEQLRWLLAILCSKPIHLPPIHFAFLEEGVFLAKMIKKEHIVDNQNRILQTCFSRYHLKTNLIAFGWFFLC
ncbi:hypothetical protein CON37_02395 [Bacillus cereus]|nr:hypothetical protein CON37_02395 [Bacillus cereus]